MALIEALIATGNLVEVYGRRATKPPSNPGDCLKEANHALVVETRPEDLDDAPAFQKRGSGFRRF